MTPIVRALFVILGCALFAGCSLPRGAALTSEVLSEQKKDDPTFQVVTVDRATMAKLASWPKPGSVGASGWIGAQRGPESQIIRSNDRVTVTIWDSQENSLLTPAGAKIVTIPEMGVSSSGTIFMPYVGNILVRGLTPPEARETLQKALAGIAPTAQVQISVQPGHGNAVDVVAGVSRPGSYPLPDRNSTILSVLAQAGGVAPGLRHPLVRLIRDGKTYEVRAERLFKEAALNTTLQGQDKIMVQEDDRYFTSLGASGAERVVNFEKENITALEAMSMVGGLNDSRANPKGVLVLREYPASQLRSDGKGPAMSQVVFTFDLTSAEGLFSARNFLIHPKDTILVTESPVAATGAILGLLSATLGVANTASDIAAR